MMLVFLRDLSVGFHVLRWLAVFVLLCCISTAVKGCTPAPTRSKDGDPNCNFTSGICEWENNDDFHWITINTTSYTNATRLLFPYPGNDDGYITPDFESDAHYYRGEEATLHSPKITEPMCMNFRFYMHGNETGILKIDTEVTKPGKGKIKERVFSRYGDHGPTWQTGQLFFNITEEYTVIITAEVGNHTASNILAIDEVSFSNETCQQLPVEHFNCTMSQSKCKWKEQGWLTILPVYEKKLNRYVSMIQGLVTQSKTYDFSKFDLRSPWVEPTKGCFRFHYRTERSTNKIFYMGRLFLFTVTSSNEELPLWSQDIYNSVDWTVVEVEMDLTDSFQVLIQGLKITGYIYFRDFRLLPNYESCSTAAERILYISSSPSHPQNLTLSEKSGYCNSYPSWYVNASLVPSPSFPQPVFVYSIYNSLILNTTRNDETFGHLQRYFYVSNTEKNNSQAIYFTRKTHGFPFVMEFGSNQIKSMDNSIVYVKEFKRIDEISVKCPYGWTEIGTECYKLYCGLKYWNKARHDCFKQEADLASFDENLDLATAYLEDVRVRAGGIPTISIGLEKIGQNWTWLNGQPYNVTIKSKTPRARLAWETVSSKWIIEAAEKIIYQLAEEHSAGAFCQKLRVNSALLKMTNQSSTILEYGPQLAVDGSLITCSHTLKSSEPSWWQVNLGGDVKLYKIKILPSPDQTDSILSNISVLSESSRILNQKTIVFRNKPTEIFYEPPVTVRQVKLETSQELVLCEVETYGTDDIRTLRGVLRSFRENLKSSSRLSHVIPSFHRRDYDIDLYEETMEAYFMTEVRGNYSFISSGDVAVELTLSSSRETVASPTYKWKYSVSEQASSAHYLASCQFYFLKIVKTQEGETYSSTIRPQNNSDAGALTMDNFFWVLPGKLEVDFVFANEEVNETVLAAPLTLTGTFKSRCNGFYCGYCPLAIFIHFAGHFECVLLQNLTAAKNGSLHLKLNDWVIYPGYHSLSMGYQIDGDCLEIVGNVGLRTSGLRTSNISAIGRLLVKPVILVTCAFQLPPNVCDRDVTFEGWNQVQLFDGLSGFQSISNTTAIFSLGWIKSLAITRVTGICIRFMFKMDSPQNTSLSLSKETSSSVRNHIWNLSGYHGNWWNEAWVTLTPKEDLMFVFEVNSASPNDSVSIANVRVTTEQCLSNIHPYYANPDYFCPNDQFLCDNGECIKFYYRCNKDTDCIDGSDEANCVCLNDEFQCEAFDECIPENQFCDGERNCQDGSDERVCDLCEESKFYCPSGKCISWNDTCNGIWDCLDGSDEPGVCGKSSHDISANKTCSLNNLGCLQTLQNGNGCDYFQGDCDFENGFCGWFNMPTNDSLEWSINQGPTLTLGTGPHVDHTTRSSTGSYVYMEASPPYLPGDKALLLGGPFQGGSALCFQFYYYMFGSDIGQLNVYKITSLADDNKEEERLLWRKTGASSEQWLKAIINIDSTIEFKIIIEAVRGKGHLGDIAIDDIIVKTGYCTSEELGTIIAFCSFDDPCDWSTTGAWETVIDDSTFSSLLQGSFIETQAPFSLSKIVRPPMATTYQCLSFWHRRTTDCHSTSLYFSQVTGQHHWNMSISNDGNEDWQFTEIPLQQSSEEYTILLDVTAPPHNSTEKCDISLDEINLSLEPCMIIQQSRPALARHGSQFYNGLQPTNDRPTVTVFFLNSSFIYGVYNKININQIVGDPPAHLTIVSLGSRVIVENDMKRLVLATVTKDCCNSTKVQRSSPFRCNLTVILDSNGENITVLTERVWILPVQLDDRGPLWANPVKDCEGTNYFGGFCYELIDETNWFDAVDNCKQLGGEFLSNTSAEESRFVVKKYENVSSFWLGVTSGYSVWKFSNFSESPNNSYEVWEESLKVRLFEGFCPVLHNGKLMQRRCSHYSQGVCKIPGKRTVIFCGSKDVKKIIQCADPGTVLTIYSAIIGEVLEQVSKCFNINASLNQGHCGFPDHTKKIKQKCDGRTYCNLENEFDSSRCPNFFVYFDIKYSCSVNKSEEGKSNEFTGAWCSDGYVSFQSSCYKMVTKKRDWLEAKQSCELDKGSNLVTVNNYDEQRFLVTMMAALNSYEFWIGFNDRDYETCFDWVDQDNSKYSYWKTSLGNNLDIDCVSSTKEGWLYKRCSTKLEYVCEYSPSQVSCDFDNGWCGWEQHDPNVFNWIRENITMIESTSILPSASNSSCAKLSPLDIFIWGTNSSANGVMVLSMNIKYKVPAFTICLWLQPTTSDGVVFSYGNHENLMISLDSYFKITIQNKTITSKADVSIGIWQHICFSIDATMRLWRFFKNGVFIETGISTTPVEDSGQITVGSQVICNDDICLAGRSFVGKMTKLNMWFIVLDLYNVSMLSSSGCGMIPITEHIPLTIFVAKNVVQISSIDQECRNGLGWRLTLVKNNSVRTNSSTLLSPWVRSSQLSPHGVCLVFAYRLSGNIQLHIALEEKAGKVEELWRTGNKSRDFEWQYGRVFLGISLYFRVHITGTLIGNESKIEIDKIFFKTGMCSPLPGNAQEWDTLLSINSTGFLSSPYYPLFYLNNMRRTWELRAPVGQRIRIKFLYLNLEDDPQCTKDFVKIEDGGFADKISFFCGRTLPAVLVSETEMLQIVFQTDSRKTRTGFLLQYDVVDAIASKDVCYFTDVPDCPDNCRCYRWPSNQTKISVTVEDLYRIPLRFPRQTSAIFFHNNFFSQLIHTDFENLPQLEYLYLNKNLITNIETLTFHKLHALKSIHLLRNFLSQIPNDLFKNTTALQILDIGANRIEKLGSFQFSKLTQLATLSLRLNRLTELNDDAFAGLRRLRFLYLDENDLSFIQDDVFKNLTELKVLFLNQNKLDIIRRKWLEGLTALETLKLNNNQLKSIERGSFDNLRLLVELDLSHNNIEEIPESLFENLKSLRRLKVDHFTLCCYAEKQLSGVSCTSLEGEGVSSCDELLKNSVLKYAIWVLGVMALFGNFGVVLWRLTHKDKNKVNSFLLTNLAVADFLMGVYLFIIAYKNTIWFGVYYKYDVPWRSSDLCIIAGIISTISSEVSVLTLSVVTFDRLICLVFPFRFRRMSMKKVIFVMAIVWLIGALIAVIPLFYDDYFYDHNKNIHFYGRSAVCLPFHLSSDNLPGWEYSSAIFLGLNGFSFLFILLAYIIMYRTITKASSAVRSTRMNQDSTLAKRMMFIIFTDFFCWFPVIIVSILALSGVMHDPRKQVYAWIAVFVLPINSSLNPFLYTFSTILGKKPSSSKSTHSKSVSEQTKSRKTTNTNVSSRSSAVPGGTVKKQQAGRVEDKNGPSKGGKPSVIYRHEMLNEAFQDDDEPVGVYENVNNSTKPTAERTFVLKPFELIESSGYERYVKTNFLAYYENDHSLTLCLVQVYDKTYTTSWESTKRILSSVQEDVKASNAVNLVTYLWSATANEISIKVDESSGVAFEPGDCVICYGYRSSETLEDFLCQRKHDVTIKDVFIIARDLIRAISYLDSKQIIHNAISAPHIIISRDVESSSVKAYLGGFSSAQFMKPVSEDQKEEHDNLENLRKSSKDLLSYGKVLKMLLENCPESFEISELDEIMNVCLAEETEAVPLSPKDVLLKVEAIKMSQDTLC